MSTKAFIKLYARNRDERFRYVVIYAVKTVCRILLLLHFLAIGWIWIGSEAFRDFEEGYTPWMLDIGDLKDYSTSSNSSRDRRSLEI